MVSKKGKEALFIVASTVLVVFPLTYLAVEWMLRKGLELADRADPFIFGDDDSNNKPRSL